MEIQMNKLNVEARPTVQGDKTPHWSVTDPATGKEWRVAGTVSGGSIHVVWVASRYYTEQTKTFKEVKLKQGTPAYEAAAKAALDFHARSAETAIVGLIAKMSGAEKLEAADRMLSVTVNANAKPDELNVIVNRASTSRPVAADADKLFDHLATEGWAELKYEGPGVNGPTSIWASVTRKGDRIQVALKQNACHAESEFLELDGRTPSRAVREFAEAQGVDNLRQAEAKWAAESARLSNWVEPKIPADCRVTVTAVKGHGTGMEGHRWSCKVWLDGRSAGEANEDGDGGPLRWSPASPAQGKAMQEYARSIGFNLGEQENAEHLISVLADHKRELDRCERILSKDFVFKLSDGKVVRYARNTTTDAKTRDLHARIQAKHPGAVELTTAQEILDAISVSRA